MNCASICWMCWYPEYIKVCTRCCDINIYISPSYVCVCLYLVAVDRMQGKVAPWVSYMGHVKRLAEELIAASAIQPSLCQMLKKNSWWSSFMMVNRKMSGMEDPLHHEEGKEEEEKDRMRKEKDQA
jgi:hypothetical protein